MADVIKMLLQAKIDIENSKLEINEQIKDLAKEVSAIKIKIDTDEEVFNNIKNINKQIESVVNKLPKNIDVAGDFDKLKIHMDANNKIYKTTTDTTLEYGKQLQVVNMINKETGEILDTNKNLTIDKEKQLKADEKVKNAIFKSMQARDQLNKRFEEAQAKAINKALDDNYKLQLREETRIKSIEEKVSNFQRKMLGTGLIQGEMDIFAEKQKGKFDADALTILRKEVEELNNLPIDQQIPRLKELRIEFGLLKQTTLESGNVITRIIENMYKFLRYYLVGGVLVGFVRNIKGSIDFIKELDKELTQVSIVQGLTRDETLELAKSYAVLADQMGKTVTEISQVNTELVRQGLNLEESQSRMNTILKLSATAGIETSQAIEIITSSVNALGEESEKTADVMLKAANISASNVGQIGEAFTKVASSAKATGMSMTELNAILSTLVEVTQESPSSLGNSLKTLLSRFNKINEETGEINESFNEVQKAFESVGITFLDADGQIRPVYNLLKDLNNIWGSLDKNTKMYISTQSAGVRQQNRFLAVMDNFNRVLEINEELIESAGTLNESYSIYLNSVEASANRAKTALQDLWIKTISSDTIKSYYEATTAIIKLIDNIGFLRVAISTLLTVFLLSNKNFTAFGSILAMSIRESGILTGSINALSTAFVGMSASAIAAKVAIIGLQVVLTFGLSLAITAVVSGIIRLINRTQELKNANAELVQSYKKTVEENQNNIKRLKDISSEYDKIKSKIENQIELNEAERRTLDEIIAINPAIIKGYDERGNAIIDTTQNIEDMIDTLKRANEIEEIRLVSGGQGLFKQARRDIKNTQNDISELIKQIDEIQYGKTITSQLTGREVRRESTGLVYLREKYDEVKEAQGEHAEETIRLGNEIRKKEIALDNLNKRLSVHKQTLEIDSAEVKNALFAYARLTDSYKDLSSEMKSFLADYIRQINVVDFKDFIEMQITVDDLVKALNNQDFSEAVSKYENLKQEFLDGYKTAEQFDEKIQELIETLLDIDEIPENLITKFFKDSSDIRKISKDIASFNQQLKDFHKIYNDAIDTVEEYNKVLQELNDKEEINYKNILKLAEEHPELLAYMNDRKKLIEEITILRDEETNNVKQNAEKQLKIIQEQLLKEVNLYLSTISIKNNIYKTDLANYKSLGEAKLALEQKIQDKIIEMNRARIYAESLTGYDRAEAQRQYVELGKNLEYAKSLLKDVGIGLDLETLDIDFSKFGIDTKTGKSSPTPYESQIDALREYQIAIQVLESEIKRYRSYAELTTSEQNRIEYLNKINDLTKQQQDKLHELNNELRNQRDSLGEWLEKQGMGVFDKLTGSFERSTEGIAKYNKMSDEMKKKMDDAIKQLDDYNSQISTHELKWLELEVTIKSEEFNIFGAHIEYLEDAIKSLNNELDISNSRMRRYNENSKEYYDEQTKQIEIIKEKQQRIREIINLLQQQIAIGNLTTEQMKNTIDSLQGWQKALWDTNVALDNMEEKLEKQLEKLADEVISAYKDYYQKRKTIALKAIDDELKSEEKRHKRIIDGLDEELKTYEEIIQAKLKLIDETQDEEEYEKQLTEAQQERQEIQNLINELSMDDSIEARTRVHELNKDLTKKDEQIEKLQNDRSIKLRKRNLQEQLDTYRRDVQAKKDAENEKYETTKQKLLDEKDAIDRYYENLIYDERRYARIREDILNGHLGEVSKDFAKFTKDLEAHSAIIGESLTQNLIDKMAKARRDIRDTLSELDDLRSSKGSNVIYDERQATIDKMQENSAKWWTVTSQAEKDRLHEENKKLAKKIGATYNPGTGKWTYHDGGIVGGRTDNITKMVNELFNVKPNEMAIKALKGELMIPSQNITNNFIPNMKGLINSMPSGGNNITIKEFLKIDNFNNNSSMDIDTLVDRATNRFVEKAKLRGLSVRIV